MNVDKIKERHAKKFKKLVSKVEKKKWELIKKYDKNYLKRNEIILTRRKNKLLKRAKTEEERQNIISNYKSNLLTIKKEYNSEKNINYHIDMLDPKSTIDHLNNNKKIHKNWLVIDAAILSALGVCTLAGLGSLLFVPAAIYTTLEVIKNVECINLQNYCIDKVNKRKESIERKQNKIIEQKSQKYGSAQNLIYKKVKEEDKIVTTKDLIESVEKQDVETLRQIKELIEKEYYKRNKENTINKKLVLTKGEE